MVGPLSMTVATFINLHIVRSEPGGLPGALMVKQGEHLGATGQSFEPAFCG